MSDKKHADKVQIPNKHKPIQALQDTVNNSTEYNIIKRSGLSEIAGSGTPLDPPILSPQQVIQMQRLVGNQAVLRLLKQQNVSKNNQNIQRALGGEEHSNKTIYWLIGELKKHYSGDIKYGSVNLYFIPKYETVDEVANAMGLKKKGSIEDSSDTEAKPTSEEQKTSEEKIEKVVTSVMPLVEKKDKGKKLLKTRLSAPLKSAPKLTLSKDKKKLFEIVSEVFKENRSPNKGDFISGLKAGFDGSDLGEIIKSPAFVYDFQWCVRQFIKDNDFLKKTEIKDLPDPKVEPKVKVDKAYTDIGKWTLRHYSNKGTKETKPPFDEIKSAMTLAVESSNKKTEEKKEEKEKKSGHTSDTDWNRYGNTGNTFLLLCIDGELMSDQPFLNDSKWYCEFPFAQPSLWLSSDWLKEADIMGDALRGSGKAVHAELVAKIGTKGLLPHGLFVPSLKAAFHNLEIKVPGTLSVDKWMPSDYK